MKKYKIIKPLGIKDKKDFWSQIEMLSGKEKGMRRPFPQTIKDG